MRITHKHIRFWCGIICFFAIAPIKSMAGERYLGAGLGNILLLRDSQFTLQNTAYQAISGSPHTYANDCVINLLAGQKIPIKERGIVSFDVEAGHARASSKSFFQYHSDLEDKLMMKTYLKNSSWYSFSIKPGIMVTKDIIASLNTGIIRNIFIAEYQYKINKTFYEKNLRHTATGFTCGLSLETLLKNQTILRMEIFQNNFPLWEAHPNYQLKNKEKIIATIIRATFIWNINKIRSFL